MNGLHMKASFRVLLGCVWSGYVELFLELHGAYAFAIH